MMPDYETNDIGVAAFLILCGFDLKHIKHGLQRSSFIFPAEAREKAEEYWNEDTKVQPRRILAELRELKARLRNERDGKDTQK